MVLGTWTLLIYSFKSCQHTGFHGNPGLVRTHMMSASHSKKFSSLAGPAEQTENPHQNQFCSKEKCPESVQTSMDTRTRPTGLCKSPSSPHFLFILEEADFIKRLTEGGGVSPATMPSGGFRVSSETQTGTNE